MALPYNGTMPRRPEEVYELVRGRRAAESAKHMPDSRIDFSDIPESTDAELKRAVRVGRPRTGDAKQLIAIRISPRLLAQLRRLAAKQSNPTKP